MRDMLAHADLARYTGQFVWLELNYDEPKNRAFLIKYGASATPSFFIIDPQDGEVAAAQTGAMSVPEITQFLDRGASGVFAKRQTPADAALKRGDALLARQPADAAKAYAEALRLAPAEWPRRELAEASLAGALEDSSQWQQCAETAATEASHMKRDVFFARTVVVGMSCLASADPAPWSNAEVGLEPLAQEALSLPTTVRDHRDAIYRTLMHISVGRNDTAAAGKWGDRWLSELDAIKPKDNEERSALDIARVENIQIYGDPTRILPALIESERVMPHNYYIASLRLAQMESAAKQYEDAIAACDRGLARSPGSNGRAWLLQIKAHALKQKGRTAEAHHALEQALQAAQEIPNKMSRDMNLKMIKMALDN